MFIARPIKTNQQSNHVFVDDFLLALNHSHRNLQKITNQKISAHLTIYRIDIKM
jgi:hypothetical protein